MAKNNFYAIFFVDGRKELVNSWKNCQKITHGVSNAKYKGFAERQSAEYWLSEQLKLFNRQSNLNGIKVYVDGSFDVKNAFAGWGYVVVDQDEIIHQDSGRTPNPALSRNIDGELYAAQEAIKWGMKHHKNLIIYHDYSGIEHWATGAWKAKSKVAIAYQEFIRQITIELTFVKVKSHAGDKYNEVADALAKKGLLN